MESILFTEEQVELFTKIWVAINVSGTPNELRDRYEQIRRNLHDDEYIAYQIWQDANKSSLRSTYTPNTTFFEGTAGDTKLIFHGGCLSCISQKEHGIDRCKGCQYFKANWGLPDLSIEDEKVKREREISRTLREEQNHEVLTRVFGPGYEEIGKEEKGDRPKDSLRTTEFVYEPEPSKSWYEQFIAFFKRTLGY